MAVENVTKFMQQVDQDAALKNRIGNLDDAVAVSAEVGLPFTAEEYEQATSELSADELKSMSGGFYAYLADGTFGWK